MIDIGYSLNKDGCEWFEDFNEFVGYLKEYKLDKLGTRYYKGYLQPVPPNRFIDVDHIIDLIVESLSENAAQIIDFDDQIFEVTTEGLEPFAEFIRIWVNKYIYSNCMIYSEIEEYLLEQEDLENDDSITC